MILQSVCCRTISREIQKLCSLQYCTKVKPRVELDPAVQQNLEDGNYKPRNHPGIFKPKIISLPDEFISATKKALLDYPIKQLLEEGGLLVNYLRARHPPVERNALLKKRAEIENRVLSEKADVRELGEEELQELRERMRSKVNLVLKSKVYAWQPIVFDTFTGLKYLVSRSAAEYAALYRIFQEMSVREPDFKPHSYFDFGSGVGTGLWAARAFWRKSLFQYVCVDSSCHMNDLATVLLKGGTGQGQGDMKGIFFRQFLPASNVSHDLVVSACSLLELPSTGARLDAVLKLWNKTERFLVVVELGTGAGFKVVSEARDLVLQAAARAGQPVHVFSPCPHDETCPRLTDDGTPCNFPVRYTTLPVGQNAEPRTELFSYVVLQRGQRAAGSAWPRVVRPTLPRARHTVCRLCTAHGRLQEVVLSAARHGRPAYRCARASQWGDLLPAKVE